mgnify:FL=1|tara:strand:+ start:1011 stop:1625 length:615 start_codon:yes stop_codon:yes gene_type:complete
MQNIEIRNNELLKLLNNFSNWFNEIDKKEIKIQGKKDNNEYYTSEEYYESINKKDHIGYPEETHGIDLNMTEATPLSFREKIRNIDKDFNSILGSRNCAVKMYYPKNGYMGWHNNNNAHGYNILFSYSKDGNGFFRFKEPKNLSTITMFDSAGWTAKVGYYGNNDEPDKLFWHCARAYEDRLTLGFVIPDKNFWQMMIEDIQSI